MRCKRSENNGVDRKGDFFGSEGAKIGQMLCKKIEITTEKMQNVRKG